MKVLGIETSCDDTAVALLEVNSLEDNQVLAEEILSQTKLHAEYGGVVPELAAREHLQNLPVLLDKVLKDSKTESADIDLLAVTIGPGLKGCLLMGLSFAKGLAASWGKDLVGVQHIEGHIMSAFLNNSDIGFPFLALVASGGHTEIVEVQELGEYKIHAKKIDDAAGEAFDKSANLLGFAYPGGAEIAKLADTVSESRFVLPEVMKGQVDFSFSGLKTAIALLIKKHEKDLRDKNILAELCYAIQDAIVNCLVSKLYKVMDQTGVESVVLTGGVAANKTLRTRLADLPGIKLYCPEFKHCMDNAAMIALVGAARKIASLNSYQEIFSRQSLEVKP